MYFQLPTVITSKNNDVHYKNVHETTAPLIYVKTTNHKIAMPARTVSGPAGCLSMYLCSILAVPVHVFMKHLQFQ